MSGSQTPAGFYPNPENPSGPKRWWDGQSWTDYFETPTPPPPPQPPTVPTDPAGSTDSGATAPAVAAPEHAAPGHGSDHAGSDHAGSDHAGTDHAGSDHAGSDHAGSGHAGSEQSAPGDGSPGQAGSSHAGSDHAGSGQAGSDHSASVHASPAPVATAPPGSGAPTAPQSAPADAAAATAAAAPSAPTAPPQSGHGAGDGAAPTPTAPPGGGQPAPAETYSGGGEPPKPTFSGIPPLNPKPQAAPAPAGEFPSLGDTIKGGWQALLQYWKPLLAIVGGLLALPTTLYVLALLRGFDGVTYNYSTGEMTGGSSNALWWNLAIIVSLVVIMAGSQAVAALLIGSDGFTGDRTSFAAAGPAIKRGFTRFPVMLGWGLVIGFVGWIILFILVFLAILSPILGFLVGLALLAGLVFVYVKFVFIQFAVSDGENVPFARSANVSRTRFWPVLGYLIVIGLISSLGWTILSIPLRFMVPVNVVQSSANDTFIIDTSGAGAIGIILFAIFITFIYVVAVGFVGGATAKMYRAANPAPQ